MLGNKNEKHSDHFKIYKREKCSLFILIERDASGRIKE